MGDPEAESPKATHHRHVHVEPHDDATQQAQVIIKREQLSEPSDFSKATCTWNMKHSKGGRVGASPLGLVPNKRENEVSSPNPQRLASIKDPLPKLAGRPQTPNTPTRAKNLEILTATSHSALHLPH